MKIEGIWPHTWPGTSILARFDLRVAPDVVLFGLQLKRDRFGFLRAYPPKLGQRPAFSIAPDAAKQAAALAAAALGHVDACA